MSTFRRYTAIRSVVIALALVCLGSWFTFRAYSFSDSAALSTDGEVAAPRPADLNSANANGADPSAVAALERCGSILCSNPDFDNWCCDGNPCLGPCGNAGQRACVIHTEIDFAHTTNCGSACKPGNFFDVTRATCQPIPSCSYGYSGFGNCCGDVGQPVCAGYGFETCKPGLHYDAATAHCEAPCTYGTGFLGACCGDVNQVSCGGPAGCAGGLVAGDLPFATCRIPRQPGQTCGPDFLCDDKSSCNPVPDNGVLALKCIPKKGNLVTDPALCKSLYSPAVARQAQDGNITLNFGVGEAGAIGVGGSAEVGVFYSRDPATGRPIYGCYRTLCYGAQVNAGIGAFAVVGAATGFDAFDGHSFVTSSSAGINVVSYAYSVGWGSHNDLIAGNPPNSTSSAVSIGFDVLPITVAGVSECETITQIVTDLPQPTTSPVSQCDTPAGRGVPVLFGQHAGFNIECPGNPSNYFTLPKVIDVCDPAPTISHSDQVITGSCTGGVLRTWTATNKYGAVSLPVSQFIVDLDTTKPVITAPPDRTIECDAPRDPSATGTATATDNCDAPTITVSEATTLGPAGYTASLKRTWTATDCSGNASSAVQTITVVDAHRPLITIPADKTIECGTSTDPSVTGSASATDNCDARPKITHIDAATPGCAGTKIIQRFWDATDYSGNFREGVQTITVVDTTKPVITRPADKTIECGTSIDPSVTGRASATDNCDPSTAITFTDSVAAGSCPNTRTIKRTWTATDCSGNAGSSVQTINVVDTTKPVITCPANITVDAASEAGTVVAFRAAATDKCDPSRRVTYSQNPGTTFPIGTTTVTSTATDCAGNKNSCQFTVTVRGPRAIELDVLAQLKRLSATVTNRKDARELADAIQDLTEANNPAWWVDDSHVWPKQGEHVFKEKHDGVHEMEEVARKNSALAPALKQMIAREVRACRILAEVALRSATGEVLAKALGQLAKADLEVARGRASEGIEHYKNAWKTGIRRDRAEAPKLGVTGTPYFAFVSFDPIGSKGHVLDLLAGAQPLAVFMGEIDRLLAEQTHALAKSE